MAMSDWPLAIMLRETRFGETPTGRRFLGRRPYRNLYL